MKKNDVRIVGLNKGGEEKRDKKRERLDFFFPTKFVRKSDGKEKRNAGKNGYMVEECVRSEEE